MERSLINDGAVVLECDEERAMAFVDMLCMNYPGLRAYRRKRRIPIK